jgi:hypothetical protein
MSAPNNPVAAELAKAINDCNKTIDAAAVEIAPTDSMSLVTQPLPSLLEQCRRLTDGLLTAPEPIRVIHHFACTGGTLISKCLACMPNTQVLSGVQPFSRMQEANQNRFHPTDIIQLVRHSSQGSDSQLEAEIFLSGLKVLSSDCSRKGLRLVLRDYAHSKYCVGPCVADTPALRDLIKNEFPERSIVTVRHPLDSFLSLQKLEWLHFQPSTLEEYCKRYLRFLDDHSELGVFRYEDFVRHPVATMKSMCMALGVPFADGFTDLFGALQLSGDSGRTSNVISPRPRRPIPDSLAMQMIHSRAYEAVCTRFDYSQNL